MLSAHHISAKNSIGIPLQEIERRKHNLWIGISLGNKFFNPKNINSLIHFGLKYTKNKLLILIPGRMQAINYRYIDKLSRAKALRKGFEDEDTKKQETRLILKSLSPEQQDKIIIANHDDICTPQFIKQREILFREFSNETLFYNQVLEVTREIIIERGRTETKDRLESLALYVFQELPWFLNGIQTIFDNTVYNAILYPGMGKLDELVNQILIAKEYSDLRQKLELRNPSGIIDIELIK